MSLQSLKTDSRLLKTSLQTPCLFFLKTSFYELLLKISFYKNSIYPNKLSYDDMMDPFFGWEMRYASTAHLYIYGFLAVLRAVPSVAHSANKLTSYDIIELGQSLSQPIPSSRIGAFLPSGKTIT
jgi:hypothetical protein